MLGRSLQFAQGRLRTSFTTVVLFVYKRECLPPRSPLVEPHLQCPAGLLSHVNRHGTGLSAQAVASRHFPRPWEAEIPRHPPGDLAVFRRPERTVVQKLRLRHRQGSTSSHCRN
ncbi:hypothetical protein J6590_001298 [Homalodisca vitripennis]|nr:hypothetical protein J6590_001298 [Homalodisca vitripennis]